MPTPMLTPTLTPMPTQTDIRALLDKLGTRTMTPPPVVTHPDFMINFAVWQWHQGVALHGLYQAGKVLGGERHRRFITDWIAARLGEGTPAKSINTTAPLLTMAFLHEENPNPVYEKHCREFAAWCMKNAPRLPDGTYEHSCTENVYPRQVWADTLFMGGYFLAKWGRVTGDDTLVDEAARQFLNHYHHLHDARTRLIFHGYDDLREKHIGVLWGRGNGWYAMATAEVLALLGKQHPAHAAMLADLRAQLAGAAATQDASGGWRTVMDDASSYLEATCTAAFACAFLRAAGLGYVDDGYRARAARALEQLEAWTNDSGDLTHSSAGTPIKPDAAGYNAIPFAVTTFSQGLGLLAFAQALKSGKQQMTFAP
ncbi:MAG: glycoside hydrolase family 88 protein [Opitutaceae bacterium]|nr:glycoside hydrolase family 88 protein [Opitutaceae bacterium]